jgi:hypothetical protein
VSRASGSAGAWRRRIEKFRLRNPDCLHCVVVDMATLWVACGRDDPQDAVMRVGEAVGTLIARIDDPEGRAAARRGLAQLILDVSESVMGNA